MNKAFRLFIILLIAASFHSCAKCGSDTPTPPVIADCIFKGGSYFVYNDSIDHIIDSQYVYKYDYGRDQGVNGYQIDECYYGYDLLDMHELSFRNGLLYDNIYTNTDPLTLYISDSLGNFGYALYGSAVWEPSYDTLILRNFNVNGTIYPTVYKNNYPLSIIENTDTVPLDLYFAQNYGIVKRVEHRPTGDVSWDLIRYHIVH